MTVTTYKNANIYNTSDRRFEYGSFSVCGRYFTADSGNTAIDLGGAYVIPGMVDVHTHGRGGFESTDVDAAGLLKLAESYAKAGTTSFMPTLMSVPMETLSESIANIARAQSMQSEKPCGAHILGTHLEGRYLNEKRRGAHNPEYLAPLDAEELAGLIESFKSKAETPRFHLTCAPELKNGEGFVKRAVGLGATVSIGHSDATCAECMSALRWGATGFTHLYNAMSPLSHRAPGCVGAALSTDAYTELICDGRHVAPEVIRLTYRAKAADRLVLITDSAPAAGLPDGSYKMGGADIVVGNGAAWLPNGTLTGSIIDIFTAVKNLSEFAGIPIEQALPCATINPARMIGADDEVGSIDTGKRADFIVTDRELSKINAVYTGGNIVK